MAKIKNNKIKNRKDWIFWTPRILSILFLLFLSLFSLDIFDPANNYNLIETIRGLFMHNIISIVLAIVLWLCWKKHQWIMGILFFLFAILYIVQLTINSIMEGFEWFYLSWSIIIALPAIVIGILFFLDWKRNKK